MFITETGGIAITPRPSAPEAEIRPAMPMRPFFGIDPALMDPQTVILINWLTLHKTC